MPVSKKNIKILKFDIAKRGWGEQPSSSVTDKDITFYPESQADEDLANKLNEIIDKLNYLKRI